MANFRQIHTRIWRDSWFIELPVDAKLCWIYIFSNENSNLAGLYEITLRQVAFDCCLDVSRVKEILDSFIADGKIMYADNVLWVKRMERYHAQGSPKIKTRKALDIASINDSSKVKKAYITAHNGTHDNTDTVLPVQPDSGDAYAAYESNVGALTPMIADSITDAVTEYTSAWVVEAIRIATQREKRNWKYILGILKAWKRDGFNTGDKPQASIADKMGPYLGQ